MKQLKFPKGFLWGSATSAYQVEGGNDNSDWEHWRVKAGKATDHYNRFEEDFEIAKSLNQNAHRFSIEWARIEPEEGKFDQKEIEHYRAVLQALRKRGIKPLVTLHHFTNPLWVAEKGGWENPATADHFAKYVEYTVRQLADLCDFWITINEPYIILGLGYLWGAWPPQKKNPWAAWKAERNLIQAHRAAYDAIHKTQPNARVGVAHSLALLRPPLLTRYSSIWERALVSRIGLQDFLGVNYYRATGWVVGLPKTDMGWATYPEGLYHILSDLKKFKLPMYITENGLADADDDQREDFIRNHLFWTHRAISEGVDVRGYFYWSLLDNFEWAQGFGPRFGLVEVDYVTFERKIRQSAWEYGKICKENALRA